MSAPPVAPHDRRGSDDRDDATGTDAPARARLPLRLRGSVTVVLALLCLVAAGIAGRALWRDQGAGATQAQGPVTSAPAREAGLTAVRRLTGTVLSYRWNRLDQEAAAVRRVSDPAFRGQYARTMSSVRAQTLRTKVTVTARVEAVGVITAAPDRVVALVFVDQTTTAQGSRRTRQDQNRVLVTVTAHGGEWRVSRMDAF